VKPLALELRHFGPYTQHTIDLAAFADDGIALAPVPSRRRISSASTTMSSFWLSVSIGTP